jgi:hypothetical protein
MWEQLAKEARDGVAKALNRPISQLARKHRYDHLDSGLYAGTAAAVLEMLVHLTPAPHVPHQLLYENWWLLSDGAAVLDYDGTCVCVGVVLPSRK